jgi:hypothetical protein
MDTSTPIRPEHREGPIARAIEEQTAKLPSDTFLWAAFGAIGLSLVLKLTGRRHDALFVGQWVPTMLLLGIYNKLVKLHGSDNTDRSDIPSRL